jgi:hypothetical protein
MGINSVISVIVDSLPNRGLDRTASLPKISGPCGLFHLKVSMNSAEYISNLDTKIKYFPYVQAKSGKNPGGSAPQPLFQSALQKTWKGTLPGFEKFPGHWRQNLEMSAFVKGKARDSDTPLQSSPGQRYRLQFSMRLFSPVPSPRLGRKCVLASSPASR